jgi:hypothetical protein
MGTKYMETEIIWNYVNIVSAKKMINDMRTIPERNQILHAYYVCAKFCERGRSCSDEGAAKCAVSQDKHN